MLELILSLDTDLLLFLNQFHTPFFDEVMHFLSKSVFLMSALLAFILTILIYGFKNKSWLFILFIFINFGLTDAISSKVFKPGFKRLRPCKEQVLKPIVHTYGNCYGGDYGFVSSHAANTMGIAILLALFLKSRFWWITIFYPYSVVVSFSRIYLGKHYPLDILGGWLLALGCSLLCYFIVKKISLLYWKKRPQDLL